MNFILFNTSWLKGFPGGASGEEPACQYRRHKKKGFNPWVGTIPREEDATHSSPRAWRTAWREEPGGLQSMGWGREEWDT